MRFAGRRYLMGVVCPAVMGLFGVTSPAGAFHPPVDKAGPLTVSIEGPAEVTQTETPIPVRVVLENGGDQPLGGTVYLAVIDRWRAAPEGQQPFTLRAGGREALDFTVTAGEGTYNAHYPIHAVALFEWQGSKEVAHAAQVVETKLDNPPRAERQIDWRPVAVPVDGGLALWRLPVRRNLHAIRSGFAPTAYFIDVWASAGPYDAWTQDGLLQNRVFTRQVWDQAFAWIRNYLGEDAPQISESGHDQLIGWLDGAQVNHLRVEPEPDEKTGWMAWPIRCKDAERIPWFDAAYHDRFVHHGAGYPGRYDAGLDPKRHGVYSDDYMCTEMLSGHPPMVSHPFGRDVVRKYWLGHDVARALALRPMFEVGFEDGDIHRQRIVWEKGRSEVLANRGGSDWAVSGQVLAPYGFRASVETVDGVVEAAVEREGQSVFEWSRSPGSLYVNARPESNGPAVRAGLAGVETSGACRVDVQDGQLRVTPLPDSPAFPVWLSWDELPWKLAKPAMADALDEQGGIIRSIDLARQGNVIELTCEPGVFAYRLGPAK